MSPVKLQAALPLWGTSETLAFLQPHMLHESRLMSPPEVQAPHRPSETQANQAHPSPACTAEVAGHNSRLGTDERHCIDPQTLQ